MSKIPDSVLEKYGLKPGDAILCLADGSKIYGGGTLLPGENELILWVEKRNNMSMSDVFALFGNPEKSQRIVYTNVAGEEQIFEGYTEVSFVKLDPDGKISLKLIK